MYIFRGIIYEQCHRKPCGSLPSIFFALQLCQIINKIILQYFYKGKQSITQVQLNIFLYVFVMNTPCFKVQDYEGLELNRKFHKIYFFLKHVSLESISGMVIGLYPKHIQVQVGLETFVLTIRYGEYGVLSTKFWIDILC